MTSFLLERGLVYRYVSAMNQPQEEWRTLDWAPNYEFSSLGRVRRTTYAPGTFAGKILSAGISNGYEQVNLSLNGKPTTRKVHRLICEAFHGPPPNSFFQTAHADGNRTNNVASNLRWALPTENSADDLKNGVRPMRESHPLAKLTEEDVETIRRDYRAFIDATASRYGLLPSSVRNLIAGRTWAIRRASSKTPPEEPAE